MEGILAVCSSIPGKFMENHQSQHGMFALVLIHVPLCALHSDVRTVTFPLVCPQVLPGAFSGASRVAGTGWVLISEQ